MALRLRLIRFDADVQLNICDLKPQAAIGAQGRGLLDLCETEQATVELARFRFCARRNADLHVIESFEVWSHRAENEKELPLVRQVAQQASVDCAPDAPASATCRSSRGNSFAELARLRTDPQHTRPALPLLRSRPGGVRAASVVRSPKSDKLSN